MKHFTVKRLCILALAILLVSAGSILAESSVVNQALFAPAVYNTAACTTVVNAGQNIQNVISSAQSGAVICVRAGTYNQQLQIKPAQSGVTVQAYPGERPILDGQGTIPSPTGQNKYMGLVHISGSNVTVDGFEVRNSGLRGVAVVQSPTESQPLQNVIVRNMSVHGSQDSGINVNGSDTNRPRNILIENNVVYDNLRKNLVSHIGGSGLAFIEVNNSIARGNVIYNNIGEGLVAGRWTENLTFEDNVSYDNQHANLYMANTINPTVRRNFIFCTDDRTYWSAKTPRKPSAGLMMRDEDFEKLSVKPPPSSGQVLINNIIVGCGVNFGVSTQVNGGGLNNALVANNTFVNARGDAGSSINNVMFEGDANYSNSRFVNNVLLQTVPGKNTNILMALGTPNLSTFTLANNLYNSSPTDWIANEPGRVVGDPKLSNPVTPVKGSVPNPTGYGIQSSSPAINAGAAVSQVTDDHFKQARSGALDIGADEQGGSGPTTGRIIVSKSTTPDRSTQVFSFTASYAPGGFQLRDDETHDSGQLAAGTYSVALAAVGGWTSTASCSDGSSPGAISLAAGETVTCSFSSQQQSQPTTRIIVRKQTIPAGDPQTFQFTSNFAGSFQLSHGGQKVTDLLAGTYNVSETVPADWTQTSATCSDGSQVGAIALAEGETVTCTFVNQKQGTGGGDLDATLYLATFATGTVGGLQVEPGDIVAYDGATGAWSRYFDGSDVGVSKPINDFEIMGDGSLLMALNGSNNLSGPGGTFKLLMQDIARFVPTSLGDNTAGSWSLYFDGSDVSLSTTAEKIDSLALKSDGTLLISTYGNASVNNGGTAISAKDEDLLGFKPSSGGVGVNTQGTWSLAFDGSTVSGLGDEDLTAAWHDNATGNLYLTVMDDFAVGGGNGTSRTVLVVTPARAVSVYWDAANVGFPGPIDSLHISP